MIPNDQHGAEVVGGSYRIDAELGRGGMARVYRVTDLRTGQPFALKRLDGAAGQKASVQAMFEREYHTLVQLAHPRIVRAFDYGVDGDRPYYTMELLEGRDAREVARNGPLGVREACLLLRDAASALALIHSRRLVHRDVSLRNLWCMPDGHGKLIDFGTLVAMGPQTRVAGTPPFVPPEALYVQPLDARCDLYGLGALAYFLLTGRNAYHAREVGDLRQLWQRRPKPPDALREEVPRALSDLVMALLSLDVRGRPASAGEVIERLTAIADLPEENERRIAQAFLTSPKLVGREQVSAIFRRRLQRARRTRGGVLAIVAPAGLGRSRMLSSFVLEAKLMGAAVVAIDGGTAAAQPFGVASALAERLLEVLPLAAAQAVGHAGVLGHVSPEVHKALGEPKLADLKPHERARRLSSAVAALVEAASRLHPVVIAVDDVHRTDGASLGALGLIAGLAAEHRVLLVTSCDESALASAPPVLQELCPPKQRVALEPLCLNGTRDLLGSLFGVAANLDDAAAWLHELSQGSPQACMQYAQYLVDRGIARYEGGQWLLPHDLREHALPPSLGAMLESRVVALSPDARALALGLSLARDETRSIWQPEIHVRIEDYPKLLEPSAAPPPSGSTPPGARDAARAFKALDELLEVGLIEQRDEHYVIAQRAMADALLRVASEAEQARAHERLAAILDQPTYQARTLAVLQLQRAGLHARAREAFLQLAASYESEGGSMDWGAMRVSLTAECSRNALAHWEREGGPVREGIMLRRMMLMTASVYDWSMARVGEAQLARLRADCGLTYWDETDPALPPLERVVECLKRAQAQHDAAPEAERGLPPGEAIRSLTGCALTLSGAYVNSHDVARMRALPDVIAPLRPLAPAIDLVWELCVLGIDRVIGRELGDRIGEIGVTRLHEQETLPVVLRQGGAAVYAHFQALEDARRGRARGLELVEVMVPTVGEQMFLVVHARWLGHAFRGNSEVAERFYKQVEVITEDDVWRRKAGLFVEAELFALTGDLHRLGRTCAAIAELADQFPGWRPWLGWAQAALHTLRGEYDAALAELDAALPQARPGEHRAWVRIGPSRAELLLLRGDAEAALREAEAVRAAVDTLSLDRLAAIAAERVRALALSRLGQHDEARAAVERTFELARQVGYEGLPLAQLHEAHARVALAAGLSEECGEALNRLRALLERADAPSLINAYEQLRGEVRELALPELVVPRGGTADSTLRSTAQNSQTVLSEASTQVFARISGLNEREDRAQQALAMLLEDAGADLGHLFLFDAGGLFAAASIADDRAEELLALARRHVDAELERSNADAATVVEGPVSTSRSSQSMPAVGDTQLTPVLLWAGSEQHLSLSGIALLGARSMASKLKLPRRELVREISRCLQSAGDCVPLSLDG